MYELCVNCKGKTAEASGGSGIALLCIQMASKKRPTMARVVSMLQSDARLEVVVM
jgi:hypothetical protein